MKPSQFLALLLFVSVGTASWAEETIKSNAEPSTSAEASGPADTSSISRIRMFGQNGATASLFRGSACVKSAWSKESEHVSGSLGGAFSSFLGAASNTSLGIAETDTSRNLSQKSGLFSKAYFREYDLPPGKPSSMRMGYQNVAGFYKHNGMQISHGGGSCSGAISFVPVAGEDYEAGFVRTDSGCGLSINRIVVKYGMTELVPVPITPAPDCPAPAE